MTDKKPGPTATVTNAQGVAAESEDRSHSLVAQVSRPAEIDPPHQEYPQHSIAVSVLGFVMEEGERAIFKHGPNDCSTLDVAPYRATVFWPVKVNDHERLYSFVRARFGSRPTASKSPIYFLKGEAELFAGAAWYHLGTPVMSNELPSRDCLGESRWRQAWCEHGVPQRVAERMGRMSYSYINRVRAIVCIGARTPYGPIVVVIESTSVSGFTKHSLTEYALDTYGDIGTVLQHIPQLVREHCDFWTWVIRQGRGWRAPAAMVAAFFGIAGPIVKDYWASLRSNEPPMLQYSLWIPTVFLLALAFVLLPKRHLSATARAVRPRVEEFIRRWKMVWLSLTAAHAVAAVLTLRNGMVSGQVPSNMLSLRTLASVAVLAATYFVYSCYQCLANATPATDDEAESKGAPPSCPHVIALLLALLVGSVAIGKHMLLELLCSVAYSVAVCLLVGRLGSRILGAPAVLVTSLYIYAVAFPISYCAWCLKSDRGLASSVALVHIVDSITSVASVLMVPLIAILFAVVAWLIHGRALERYLLNIDGVARLGPRRTLRSAWHELRMNHEERD